MKPGRPRMRTESAFPFERQERQRQKELKQVYLLTPMDRATLLHAKLCGVVCVILRLAVLIQYRSVTDRHTHDDGIYRASIASRGKNCIRLLAKQR